MKPTTAQAGSELFDTLPDQRPPETDRRDLDFYPTAQPEAIRALLSRDDADIFNAGGVWEPAVGNGDLIRPISEAFPELPIVGSDVVARNWPATIVKSFYSWDAAPQQAIICNPPFCEINARDGHGRWLRHTLDLPGWTYCAYLLSWDWPAARMNGLGQLLDENPFSYCYLMRWKLDFTGEGSPPQRNAWFVWNKNYRGAEPAFRFLDRNDSRQSRLAI